MRAKHIHYSEEFKKNALHLLANSSKSSLEPERNLGVSHELLYKWEQCYQVNPTTETLEHRN